MTLVSGALACAAVRGWPGAVRLATLMGTMLCIQFAIGVINDWADRALDAVAKPEKPIPSGLVTARAAIGLGLLLIVIASVLAARFGPLAWLLAMAGLGIGLAYDLGVKRTPLSALTYATALPLLPVWVWTAMDRQTAALWAVLPVGALLGFGLQLANALTDAESDTASGVHGTLQSLGPKLGWYVAYGSIFFGVCAALFLGPFFGLRVRWLVTAYILSMLLLGGANIAYLRNRTQKGARRAWPLLASAVAVMAVGWFASLP